MRLLAVFGFLVLLAQAATALYEDQAGKFDWSVQNLGRVFAVEYGSGDKRGTASAGARGTYRALYVATDRRSRALARLDAKSGAIKWRRVLANGDDIDSILLMNSGLLSLSGSGRNIRMWDVTDGSLLWDNVLELSSGSTLIGVGDDRVLAIGARLVSFVSLKEGAIVWSASLPMDKVSSTVLSADASVLFVLGYADAQQRILSVDVTTGVVSEKKAHVDGDFASLLKSEAGEAVLATVTTSLLKIQSLEAESKSSVRGAVSVGVDGAAEFTGFDASATDALVVRLSSGKRVYARILGSLDLDVVEVLSSEGIVADASSEDAGLLHVVGTSRSQVQVKAFSPGSLTRWDAEVKLDVHGGEVAKAFGGCQLKKKDSNVPRCRVLLVLKDDGLVMTANDESSEPSDAPTNVLWTREEALANIKEVHWITPAETEIEKQPLKGIPTFFEDLEQDAERLKQLVRHVIEMSSTFFGSKASSPNALSERQEQPNSHFFGFSKYIVLLTESGRLFAIRAETNVVAWSAFVGPEYRLFVTRDHPALGAGAELLLVSNSSKLVWFDGDDGHQIDQVEKSRHGSAWVVLLPKRKHTSDEDASLRRPVALVDSESLAVTIFPKNGAGVKYPEADNFYFSRFDEQSGAFVGYAIEHSAADSYVARPVWAVAVPTGHSLVATSRQRDGAVVDSSVTTTGDDSLLLKYLNPHMFGFVTEAYEVLHGEQKAAPVLYVTLVDSVTGRVIHRVRHMHGTGPVQMVQSENWVVYAFWNAKEKRTDLVSLSLYDGAVGSHSLNLWKRPAWNDQRSSFDPRAPFVLQKAFIFPAKIETLGVTVTSRGITPQYILVGMQTGQIFKLNRALIDPRQPDKPPTPEEQNEGLMMYTPLIPLHNHLHSMVTYNQTIAGLKKIATTPVELESTTLLFAHGLDLFYLRLAPAKAFDVLPPDFNYELLVLLCLGFFGATYVLKTLTLRKSLNEAWK